jgi:hypothetical protein
MTPSPSGTAAMGDAELYARILCWFSCGAASAVATKKTIERFGATTEIKIVCCDTRSSENPDNYRFSAECEKWFDQPIIFLKNEAFGTIDDVFEATGYMAGVRGARCTTELKKKPRHAFQRADDRHVFGYTADEGRRIANFEQRNPELRLIWILRDLGIDKDECYRVIRQAGIALPAMYGMGFKNNNCPGCVKASSPRYWALVREKFPEVFKRRSEQSRKIGVRLVEIRHHERIFLDELPEGDFGGMPVNENVSCGPECGVSP